LISSPSHGRKEQFFPFQRGSQKGFWFFPFQRGSQKGFWFSPGRGFRGCPVNPSSILPLLRGGRPDMPRRRQVPVLPLFEGEITEGVRERFRFEAGVKKEGRPCPDGSGRGKYRIRDGKAGGAGIPWGVRLRGES
jgi:hypothetical protein